MSNSTGVSYPPPSPCNPINQVFNSGDYNQGNQPLTQNQADTEYTQYDSPAWFSQLAVQNNGAYGGNLAVSGDTVIGGTCASRTVMTTAVNTQTINVSGINWTYSYAGSFYLTSANTALPILKSIPDTTHCYTNFNLQTPITDNFSLLLLPQFTLTFYDANNNVLRKLDNSVGTDILFSQMSGFSSPNCSSIQLSQTNAVNGLVTLVK